MFDKDFMNVKLPPEMLAPSEPSAERPPKPVPEEIAITEEPFELPFGGKSRPADVLSRAANQLAAAESRATQAEYRLHSTEESSLRQREKVILGIIEVLDRFRDVLGSFHVAEVPGHQESASGGSSGPRNTQPITAPGLENLRVVEHAMQELLRDLDVAEVKVRVGRPADIRQHEILRTRRRKHKQDGTVVRVVRPGYRIGERILRPACVETVQNAPAVRSRARRRRVGTP